jgi:hypothetical protein
MSVDNQNARPIIVEFPPELRNARQKNGIKPVNEKNVYDKRSWS